MTYVFNRKQIGLAVSLALTLGFLSGAASAQSEGIDMKGTVGYVVDQRGHVAKSGTGLCWRTGYWTPAMAIAECDPDLMPKVVAAAQPDPIPVSAKPTPRPAAEKFTLAADTLFDFNKASLRPEGIRALDDLLLRIQDITPEVITAVGHADRFGSDEYNQKLSEKRAATVKDYLIGKGIEANRVQTEGKGETQPVTKADQCLGAKSKKVIECLQPDRRVEIEVVGTKTAK